MSQCVLILGESGAGKSTSIRNLDSKKTFVFSALGKKLPFKGSEKNYTVFHKEKNPKGNFVISSSAKQIVTWLRYISSDRPEITTIVVDDNTFLPAKELDRRRDETGYGKYSDIAHDFLEISEVANTLREDLNIYFLHHIKVEGDGILEDKKIKAQSFGKLIDEKLASIEAQFNIVLLACKMRGDDDQPIYQFKTRDINSTAKSPYGMFDEEYIDNDLAIVNEKIKEYYN